MLSDFRNSCLLLLLVVLAAGCAQQQDPCGDGTCDTDSGENDLSCPADCPSYGTRCVGGTCSIVEVPAGGFVDECDSDADCGSGTAEAGAELNEGYCAALGNRQECIEYCSENDCAREICDAMLFDADGCTECGTGCCSLCTDLAGCTREGCYIAWVFPEGDSVQFGGCENIDMCMQDEELCDYALESEGGYREAAALEGGSDIGTAYEYLADSLKQMHEARCG